MLITLLKKSFRLEAFRCQRVQRSSPPARRGTRMANPCVRELIFPAHRVGLVPYPGHLKIQQRHALFVRMPSLKLRCFVQRSKNIITSVKTLPRSAELFHPGARVTDQLTSPWPTGRGFSFPDDAECVRFIISANIHRRHLTDEQRDQIGARLVTMQANGDRADAQNACRVGVQSAAALVHSTPARINRARTIERADPDLAQKVINGEISKGAALRQIV